MAIENLEQKRLIFAKEEANANDDSYASLVKKVPAYIQNNGLLYTLAFLKDKDIFKQIKKWHTDKHNILNFNGTDFLTQVFALTDDKVRLLTIETLSLFKCLRRFVKEE